MRGKGSVVQQKVPQLGWGVATVSGAQKNDLMAWLFSSLFSVNDLMEKREFPTMTMFLAKPRPNP